MGGQFTAMSYILEYVPTAWRGFYGSLLGVIYSIGVVGNAAVGWLVMPWGGWRALMVVTNLPFGELFICMSEYKETCLCFVH